METCRKLKCPTQSWERLPPSGRASHLRLWLFLAAFLLLLSPTIRTVQAADGEAAPAKLTAEEVSKISAICVSCHTEESRGIVQQWGQSKHYGAKVGCYECHQAEKGDPDAVMHKKYLISVLVTPKDCGRCHPAAAKQYTESKHAQAASSMEKGIDHTLATVVQGNGTEAGIAAATTGCVKCHGSKVKIMPSGKFDPATWPNSGIGRVNPDGSVGTCTACHQQHDYSLAQSRRPETCGRCHQGSAHAQQEIYGQSKHGIGFQANLANMHLDSPKWIPGQDYVSGPTCATCHMSATLKTGVTHDVSQRISWNLTQPVSKKDEKADDRRKEMRAVCTSCHTEKTVLSFYEQFDNIVNLYDSKYGEPGSRLMEGLLKAGLRTEKAFDDPIEWTWFKLWHQAGRNARQGAAMQAPDFVQWQGFYEIARLFYAELIPQAEALIQKAEAAGRGDAVKEVKKLLDDIKNDPANKWMNGQ